MLRRILKANALRYVPRYRAHKLESARVRAWHLCAGLKLA